MTDRGNWDEDMSIILNKNVRYLFSFSLCAMLYHIILLMYYQWLYNSVLFKINQGSPLTISTSIKLLMT